MNEKNLRIYSKTNTEILKNEIKERINKSSCPLNEDMAVEAH